MVKHIFTVDLEDWFHTAFREAPNETEWDLFESRIEARTLDLLHVLDKYDARATFFVLGWIAKKYPDLILEISEKGHEIGIHGYGHRILSSFTPETFARDVDAALGAVRSTGVNTTVVGYRAPCYSLTPETSWVWEVLADNKFRYDASVFPYRRHNGGWPGGPSTPYKPLPKRAFWEIPIPLGEIGPLKFVFSAGGYLRITPKWAIMACLKRLDQSGKSAVFIVHPRDIDPRTPLSTESVYIRLRQKLRSGSTMGKLNAILDRYSFTTMDEAVKELERKG